MSDEAKRIAALKTGLRPDQVDRVIAAYRDAVDDLCPDAADPQWKAISHFCGSGFAVHQYNSDETKVTLQIDNFKSRGDEWKAEYTYLFGRKRFSSFAEARLYELEQTARPAPYAVSP